MKSTRILITLFIICFSTQLATANVTNSVNQFKTVGTAEMRWLMFPLYQIALKTPNGKYQQNSYPKVLDITYRRSIEKRHLISATDQQWQRLGLPQSQRQQWTQQLNNIWPSVKPGDQLAFQVNADGKNTFIYNGRNIGGVADQQFGESFLSIWLSPNTSQPGIRQRLISPGS